MAAADPPPSSEGHSAEDAPAPAGGPVKRGRRRILIGRFRIKSPLPAIEIAGVPATEPEVASPPRPELPAVSAPIFDGLLGLTVLILAVFLSSFAAINADLWLHLAAGRLVAHGQFPFGADPFSAVPSATWINHAWLFDLFLYLLYHTGGAALVAVKAGLVVIMTIVLLALRRPTGTGLGPAAATTLVLLAVSPFLLLRSPTTSYLLFAVLLWILHRRFGPNGRWQLPAVVALLFVLWVNVDGGFVFGLLLLAVWTVGGILQRIVPLGDGTDDLGEPPHPPIVLGIALLAALIACFLNPYHFRVFRWPAELTALALPDTVRLDSFIEQYLRDQFFVSPLSAAYTAQAGMVAAYALYVVVAAGLASFALNAAGWQWRRVLAWTMFVCLGTSFGRMVPYLALVGGPAVVLNTQAFLARRRGARSDRPNPRLEHFRAMLAATCRTGLLLTLGCLLALAWPGWLGADARIAAAPARRVVWRAVPPATQERLANRLAEWYKAGALKEGEARGFHLHPDFAAYCAWFCPAEKGFFDSRLTAPPDIIADYLQLRWSVAAMGSTPGPERTGPPDRLLRKHGITHLVLSGPEVLPAPPGLSGLGEFVFADAARFTPWAIEGRGLICGWENVNPKLRLDATRLAVGESVEPLPEPREVVPPAPPSLWDRYRLPLPPPPPEAFEAGLWLADHEATAFHGNNGAIPACLIAAELVRLAPTGPPVLSPPPVIQRNAAAPPTLVSPLREVQKYLEARWRQTQEGRAGRAATLLAIRAARRAILADPQHPDAYCRLAQSYAAFETDPVLGIMQELTAARQAVTRFEAAVYRPMPPRAGMFLHIELSNLYQRLIIPGTQARPEDLILESLTRFIELRRTVFAPRAGTDPDSPEVRQFEQEEKILQQELEQQAAKVRKRSDDYENATPREASPKQRAGNACRFGLVREALNVLQKAGKELDAESILMMANLFLLTGEAENARDLLQSAFDPVERLPPDKQLYVHFLSVQAAAALGNYPVAIDHCDAVQVQAQRPAAHWSAQVLADLVFPDIGPGNPLTRVATMPAWGGLWREGRPLAINNTRLMGALFPAAQSVRDFNDWTVRQGILALEAGEIPLARRQLTDGARGWPPTDARLLAQHWLELWRPQPSLFFR